MGTEKEENLGKVLGEAVIEAKKAYDRCFICHSKRYYQDNNGVWHKCPQCNPELRIQPTKPYPWFETQTTKSEGQDCLVRKAFEEERAKGNMNPVIGISCPCPKCSPRC